MFDMKVISRELYAARPYFKTISPSPLMLPVARFANWVAAYKVLYVGYGAIKMYRADGTVAAVMGDVIGGRIIKIARKPVRRAVTRQHLAMKDIPPKDLFRKNGLGGRAWITKPGQYDLVVVFHDANRAGPHIDVHIGRMSLVYRVKPDLYAQLKYNREGMLTENSRKLILDHVRSEVANGSRVPQNLDHSRRNARGTWVGGDPSGSNYGDGRTRQIVLDTRVEITKAHRNGPIEFYAPDINKHRGTYLFRLYPGSSKRTTVFTRTTTAPILKWGVFKSQPPKLEDRLHLQMKFPEDIEKIKADFSTSTAKYDGSSAYVVITDEGTRVWSPRTSVRTGEQIEYTHKLDGVANTRSSHDTVVGMGEVLFYHKEPRWHLWKTDRTYLSSAAGGGILNSDAVLPSDVGVEIRLYRIDRIGRVKTGNLPFWDNRVLQQEVAALNPELLKVVELMSPEEALARGFEGFVVAKEGLSINDGIKVKWWEDPEDWRVDKVDFFVGPNGSVAGVTHYTNLDNGKTYKLGAPSTGNQELTRAMMANPSLYEGTVFKVQSRQGHSGRAAKVVAVHTDKGTAPV